MRWTVVAGIAAADSRPCPTYGAKVEQSSDVDRFSFLGIVCSL